MKKFLTFHFSLFTLLLLSVATMTSCSESDDVVEEYADWQNVNDTYFADLYAKAKSGSDKSLKVIRNWSMPTDENSAGYQEKAVDCIVVKVLEEGAGKASPLYTDTVSCHYEGRLLPSATNANGLVFDKSYYGTFNAATATPTQFVVSGLVDGFTTALQNMHPGDHWQVHIPYQLGYGTTQSSGSAIPAYSTLIFDIRLVDFWHPY